MPTRILFVDDHEMNRHIVRGMLEVAGLSMDEAPSAELGLRMIDREDYDLVLMDLRMPGMDGLAALREIRARRDAKAKVPVVVLTGDTGQHINKAVEDAGGDDMVHKPIVMENLFDAITRVLFNTEAQAEFAIA